MLPLYKYKHAGGLWSERGKGGPHDPMKTFGGSWGSRTPGVRLIAPDSCFSLQTSDLVDYMVLKDRIILSELDYLCLNRTVVLLNLERIFI